MPDQRRHRSTAVTATAVRQRPGIRTFTVGSARCGTRHEELVVSAEDVLALLPGVIGWAGHARILWA